MASETQLLGLGPFPYLMPREGELLLATWGSWWDLFVDNWASQRWDGRRLGAISRFRTASGPMAST